MISRLIHYSTLVNLQVLEKREIARDAVTSGWTKTAAAAAAAAAAVAHQEYSQNTSGQLEIDPRNRCGVRKRLVGIRIFFHHVFYFISLIDTSSAGT